GGSGTTTLTTNDLALNGGALSIGDAGLLVANASTTAVSNVTMIGGTSGTITLTSGSWTVSGNWDTSGLGSSLIAGTSTVTLTGASTTLTLATGQMFYSLVIGGTISITSPVTAAGILTVNNGAVLTKTGQSITFNGLTEIGSGSIADGAISVGNFSVTNSDATNLTTITVFTTWTVDSQYTWTDSSTVGTSTITFTIGGNTVGYRFNVMKDAAAFTNGIVNGSGQVVFAMLGSDPVVDVILSAPCGVGNRYWIGGTGSWSQTTHWSSSSGGVNGCSMPNASNPVFFDANSGGGMVTVDLNAAMSSFNTTGWTGTVVFDSTSSQTMTFAALAGREFYSITFRSAAGSGAITFSMATNGLRWSNLLTIQDGAGSTTTLATANLSLTGGSIAVDDSGILVANASTVSAADVTVKGSTSGTIT